MEKKETGELFRDLKEDISAYLETKTAFLKLTAYERIAKMVAILSFTVIVVTLCFFAFLFLFLALSHLLGEVLGSMSAGYSIVVGIYGLAILLFYLNKQRIVSTIQNNVIAAFLREESNDTHITPEHEEGADTAGDTTA